MRSPRTVVGRLAVEGRGLDRSMARVRPAHAGRAVFGGLLLSVVLGLVAPSAFAAKTVDGFLGGHTASVTGDRFIAPNDVAVVEATGDVYVAYLQRVQRLDSDGGFELLWGKDVVADGAPGDTGTGGEVCTVAADCTRGVDAVQGGGVGEFDNPTGVAVNEVAGHPQSGHVYVRDTGNMRVQEFDADGGFVRAWGWGVATGAEAFEVCTSNCQQGLAGGGDGQLGATGAVASIAVDPSSGNVYVADPANQRIQEFQGDGGFVDAFGSAFADETPDPGEFAFDEPARIAVDSSGVVYATDSNDSARVQRYDTTTDAFLAPIGAPPLTPGATQGIEIDPTTDNLLVVRDSDSGETVVEELDTTTLSVVDTHAVGDGFGLPNAFGTSSLVFGLGVDGARGKLYVPSAFFRSPDGSANVMDFYGVFVLDGDGAAAPSPVAGAPLTVDDDSAVLTGTVDPNGPSYYRFEYSKNGIDWKLTDNDNGFSNAKFFADRQLVGSSPQPVSATLEGLEANTVYRVRIVATKLAGPLTEVVVNSPEATFLTDAVPPTAETATVHSYTDTSAWLSGRVNPKGSATSYRFEWGQGTDYAHQAPVADASAGSGAAEKGVLEEIVGLEPDTVYHYRLVAESSEGVTVGADRTFRTRSASGGFADRAYEQVTPAVKSKDVAHPGQGGAIISTDGDNGYATWPVAGDGDALMWGVSDALADAEQGGTSAAEQVQFYRAGRGSGGWSSRLVMRRPPGPADQFRARPVAGSVDLSRFLVTSLLPLLDGADDQSFYLRDPFADELVSVTALGSGEPSYGGMSDDLSHVFSGSEGGVLYEWVGGLTRLVSVDAGGVPFAGPSQFGSGNRRRYAVSRDGEHAFFSTPVGSDQTEIYRRSHGTTTTLVSPSQRSAPDPQGSKVKVFEAGSPDGGRVLFSSSEELTDDANTGPSRAGRDLYRYDVSSDTLVDVTADDDPDGGRFVGLLGASDDADWVYYVARGQVAEGATAGRPNVYLWRDDGTAGGETRFIATLSDLELDAFGDYDLQLNSDFRFARVTADGRALVFHSPTSLTGYRNQGFAEVFIYEADANGGEGVLSCVSCRPNGTPAHGDSAVPKGFSQVRMGSVVSRALSSDGRRVFFNSADALVPEDVNGEFDVYEWEAGRLRLVSTGTSPDGSDFVGASEDGDDVFFITRDRLVGQDADGLKDVYDARVGGGFASQNPVVEAPCVGEACRAALSGRPPAGDPASRAAGGEGDYARLFSVAGISARQRRLLASRGRVTVRVDVTRPGRIDVRALRGSKTVGSGSRIAKAAGLAKVTVKLTRSARRSLSRRGRLRLRLVVRFGGESETATIDLRRVK